MITTEPGSPEHGPQSLSPEVIELSAEYMNAGFHETDMQFNIARVEGKPRRGYDVINRSSKERIYITQPGSTASENIVKSVIGSHAVLESIEVTDTHAIYNVPRGARLLHKTLKSGPYEKPYMQALAYRGYYFLEQLSRLDGTNAFGIDSTDIALTHNGFNEGEDDVFMTIVSPLDEPSNPLVEQLGVDKFIRRQLTSRMLGKQATRNFFSQSDMSGQGMNPQKSQKLFVNSPMSIDQFQERFDVTQLNRYIEER